MFDLETVSLEIKTNSKLGSGETVYVKFYELQGDYVGGVNIYFIGDFDSPPTYFIHHCMSLLTNFRARIPRARRKTWKIIKTKTSDNIRLQIYCNDVKVLDEDLSDEKCVGERNWRDYWNRDVKMIYFARYDTATDYFGPVKS